MARSFSLAVAGAIALLLALPSGATILTSDPSVPVLYPAGVYSFASLEPEFSGARHQFDGLEARASGPVNRVPNGRPSELETFGPQALRARPGQPRLVRRGDRAIYSHVTVPLDVDLDRTPVHEESGRESWNTFVYCVRVDWGSDGIGDVAKRTGFERVYYADPETLTVLGVWEQRWARVYGERRAPWTPPEAPE